MSADTTVNEFNAVAESWRPGPAAVTGRIEAGPTEKLSSLLGVSFPGDGLPPLWQEVHLRDAVGIDELGEDGHPRAGSLLPPLTDRRRMFGGGTVELIAPLKVGDLATRTSTVTGVRVRQGRSGPLLLVAEEHLWSVRGEDRIRERRDIVYRRSVDMGTAPAAPAPSELFEGQELTRADARYLMAYSALTYNLHRIHYDDLYAREVEHHPALVVHGPLLALWCAELAREHFGRFPRLVSYRLTSPAYVGQDIGLRATSQDDGTLLVEAGSQGRVCVRMSVTA